MHDGSVVEYAAGSGKSGRVGEKVMKILFISLGCDKNLSDSEKMLGLLAGSGYEITDDETEADVIVINTCAFIHDAKEESIQSILEMAEYRKAGSCRALLVAGCLAQRYGREIMDEIEEVDAVLGSTCPDRILEALDQVLKGQRHLLFLEDINRPFFEEGPRMLTTGGHYAYLKIAEGCSKRCTYCIIPHLKGRYRSIPMEKLVKEAEGLAAGRGEGTDPCGPGNHSLRNGSVRRKVPSSAATETVPDTGDSLDPDSLLLSGRNLRRADPDHEGRGKGLPLSGSSDTACQQCDTETDGKKNHKKKI